MMFVGLVLANGAATVPADEQPITSCTFCVGTRTVVPPPSRITIETRLAMSVHPGRWEGDAVGSGGAVRDHGHAARSAGRNVRDEVVHDGRTQLDLEDRLTSERNGRFRCGLDAEASIRPLG